MKLWRHAVQRAERRANVSIYVANAQLESNGTTLATTYIPTTTATVTRSGVKHEFSTPAALSRTEGCRG
jgi:hypothetical protein